LSIDVFESAIQPQGRFGAVFERDDETARFYLVDLHRAAGKQIIGTFGLAAVVAMRSDIGVRVTWTPEGEMAGLLVDGRLMAVFDLASVEADGWEAREAKPTDRGRFLDG